MGESVFSMTWVYIGDGSVAVAKDTQQLGMDTFRSVKGLPERKHSEGDWILGEDFFIYLGPIFLSEKSVCDLDGQTYKFKRGIEINIYSEKIIKNFI